MEDSTELEFEGRGFTDADLKNIPALERVKLLGLWETSVTDDGIAELRRAESLGEISILSSHLSNFALQVLAELSPLRSLQIHRGPRIDDFGLRFLSKCSRLRELYLKGTAITDAGLESVAHLPNVWSLILDDTRVSDDGCAALAGLPELSLLGLERTRVTGAGLARLRDERHLDVYLDGARATDAGVIALAERLSKLRCISLRETRVGDASARALSRLPHVGDVRLSGTQLTDDGLAAFTNHPSLSSIYVERCSVSAGAIKALKNAAPHRLTVYTD